MIYESFINNVGREVKGSLNKTKIQKYLNNWFVEGYDSVRDTKGNRIEYFGGAFYIRLKNEDIIIRKGGVHG